MGWWFAICVDPTDLPSMCDGSGTLWYALVCKFGGLCYSATQWDQGLCACQRVRGTNRWLKMPSVWCMWQPQVEVLFDIKVIDWPSHSDWTSDSIVESKKSKNRLSKIVEVLLEQGFHLVFCNLCLRCSRVKWSGLGFFWRCIGSSRIEAVSFIDLLSYTSFVSFITCSFKPTNIYNVILVDMVYSGVGIERQESQPHTIRAYYPSSLLLSDERSRIESPVWWSSPFNAVIQWQDRLIFTSYLLKVLF